ncbi:hypothetical protein SCALM49S_07416 [Streptomyces californicus]
MFTGALLVAGAAGLRWTLHRGPAEVWAPALVGVFGLSFWAAAAFPADAGAGFPAGSPDATVMSGTGAVHMAAGMISTSLCVRHSSFWPCRPARAPPGVFAVAVASRVVPAAVFVGFMGLAVSVLAFTAGAGLGPSCRPAR